MIRKMLPFIAAFATGAGMMWLYYAFNELRHELESAESR